MTEAPVATPAAAPAAAEEGDLKRELTRLKEKAHTWTAAEDAKLEVCMKALETRLNQRAKRLELRITQFDLDMERAHAELGNVFNEFDGLSHSQVPSAASP